MLGLQFTIWIQPVNFPIWATQMGVSSHEVNIADQRKRTPIHLAAAGGHMQVEDPVDVGKGLR